MGRVRDPISVHGAPGEGAPGAGPGMVPRVRGSEFRSQHGESEGGTEKRGWVRSDDPESIACLAHGP